MLHNGRPAGNAMRILIATTYRGIIAGTEVYLTGLIPALRARGHEVALIYQVPTPDGRGAIDVDCPTIPAWGFQDPDSLEAAAGWQPDLCYLQGMLTPSAEEQLTSRFPTVFFAHNYFATCASGTKCHRWPSAQPCTRAFGLACLPLNYVRQCGYRHPLRFLQRYREQRRRERLLGRFTAVLVASRHMAEVYRQQGVPPERIALAPLFPTAVSPLPEPPARRPMTGELLMVGRFTNLKGGDYLIKAVPLAAKRLGCRLSLVFAGEGPEEEGWKQLAARLGVDARFLGWCSLAQLAEQRARADLLAVPSVWPEPFGLVGIEAGCEGLPTVGFAVGGIPDWLIPGQSGESAPAPITEEGLAAAIVRALADPDHHHRLRIGAWEVARQFTLARHLGILEAVFKRAVNDEAPDASANSMPADRRPLGLSEPLPLGEGAAVPLSRTVTPGPK
jgi:glycosyltransferase involved in cell wall biosynthesis